MKSLFGRNSYFFDSTLRTPLLRNPRIWLNFLSHKDITMATGTHSVYDKLKALNITLPDVSAPAAAYLPLP
ncbi:hypothetical protein RCH06_002186 [Polaromonas sp. CG_9.5]|nr:hypothetical protein [Polaromonas sp. CG_9.5]